MSPNTSIWERLVWEGARRRYPDLDETVRRRVRRELCYVKDLRLAGYFLTVRDLVAFCHRNDILVNTRGSAPGSILCYALGISMVDPIAAGLMFERFMSSDRDEPPDIDLDIEHQERERVIQYVYQRYGRRRAAMVANVICFRGRSAIRDVGKALGLPLAQVDRLAQRLQWHPDVEMPHPDQAGGDAPREVSNRVGRELLELSRQIVDFPRHLGIHTGGMIIASHPLDASVPIEPATMDGRTVAQWDKDDCADAGLLKIDLLGLGMLTLIQRAFRLIEQRRGRRLALADFTFDDPKVYDAICAADTIGMFQVESRAQMHVLPQTRPRCFYDLVVQIAIIRPGPMTTKMHRRWILRRTGQEAADPVWPGLASVLQRTLGLPIFQEQCLQIAMVAAGFSATKADALRRAMSRKRSLAHIQALQDDLMQGMVRNGIPAPTAEQIYAQIEGYAGYGFPEAHSCAFALLVYVSAWLKVHHHAEFTCAILNSQPMGFYSPHTLIGDAQRHEVTVHPVDIQHSSFECTVEPDGAVRLGYRYVEGLGEAHRKRLDGGLARGPYRSLEDFCRRTRLPSNVLEALATAGAFRSLGLSRRAALWQVRAYAPTANATGSFPALWPTWKSRSRCRRPTRWCRSGWTSPPPASQPAGAAWSSCGRLWHKPACCAPPTCKTSPPSGGVQARTVHRSHTRPRGGGTLASTGFQSRQPCPDRAAASATVKAARHANPWQDATASGPTAREIATTGGAAAGSSRAWATAVFPKPCANRPAPESWSPWPAS